ncbi:MAG TPA: DUF2254 domain-containing protein [Longimicrobiales bacterium]
MVTKLGAWLEEAQDHLWFLPAIMTAVAMGLALLTVEADLRWIERPEGGGPVGLIFRGGPGEARAVLAAVAGGIITVAGVVFSITLVTLRAASEQFSPRLLREFTSDVRSQATLGVFTATFVYSLVALRSVRSEEEWDGPFVPALTVTVVFGLSLVSIGFLIYFIGYLAREIQAGSVVDRVVKGIHVRIEHLFPEEVGRAVVPRGEAVSVPSAPPAVVRARVAGYVTEVDEAKLFGHADGRLLIRMEVGVGAFVVPGEPLASVWPAERVDPTLGAALRDAFVLGRERTIHHDVEHGFIELSDIAVKAMSPAINDPTTATICLDRMSEALVALGRRDFPPPVRLGRDGRVWLIARQTEFERIVSIAFGPIRHYGREDPSVLRRLLEALGRAWRCLPAERRPPLEAQGAAILREAERHVEERLDLEAIREAAWWMATQGGGRAAGHDDADA